LTEPFPLPDAADVIVSQLLDSVAFHAQPAAAVMWMVPVEASAPTLSLAGEIVYAHGAGAGGGAGAGVGDGAGDGGGVGEGGGTGTGSGSGLTPACSIVTVCWATVTVPVLGDGVLFVATVTVTVPERLLAAVAGTPIHETPLVADHEQPVSVSTESVTVPPFAETAVFAGETLYRHGAASCVTVTWILLTSTIAWRGVGSALALTR
jgi:hypothetical protein